LEEFDNDSQTLTNPYQGLTIKDFKLQKESLKKNQQK